MVPPSVGRPQWPAARRAIVAADETTRSKWRPAWPACRLASRGNAAEGALPRLPNVRRARVAGYLSQLPVRAMMGRASMLRGLVGGAAVLILGFGSVVVVRAHGSATPIASSKVATPAPSLQATSCAGNPAELHCTPTEVQLAQASPDAGNVLPSATGATLTRHGAIALVRSLTFEYRSITSTSVKLTTLGAVQAARGEQLPAGLSAGLSVWAVAVTGDVHPEFLSPGATGSYRWAIVLIDPVSGVVVSDNAGPENTVPGWFTAIPDSAGCPAPRCTEDESGSGRTMRRVPPQRCDGRVPPPQ